LGCRCAGRGQACVSPTECVWGGPGQAATALYDMGKFFVDHVKLIESVPFLSLSVYILELMFGEDR
jgi:hypothetical protein